MKFLKEYLKNQIKRRILGHSVKLHTNEDSMIFKLENTGFFGKKYLLIEHRDTGKRISKPVMNSLVELTNQELEHMGELGIFDIYLKLKLGKFEFVERTKFDPVNKNKFLINKKEKTIFRSYITVNSNLSFTLKEALFDHDVTSLESDQNQVLIEGVLDLFQDIKFDSVELALKSDEIDGNKIFNCEYEKEKELVHYNVKINLEQEMKYLNTTWDILIRLKNKDIILFEDELNGRNLKEFKTYEDYYLAVIDNKISLDISKSDLIIVNYYYATINNFIKFKITTKDKWLETLNRAKNKTIFEECIKKEKIDNNLFFFESFHGQSYSNSPKYVYEEMLKRGYGDKYTFVWSYKGNLEIPGNSIIVNESETEYFKYLARAKYWVNNATFPIESKQNKGVYLQTWHGTPLKRLGFDVKVENPKITWYHLNRESRNWNFLISANNYSSKIFRRAFEYDNKILEVGYPSNDIFYNKDINFKNSLKEKFNFGDKKVILYAPTFRDDDVDLKGEYYFNLLLDLNRLYDKFKEEYVILLKTHSVVSKSLEIDEKMNNFVFDFSNYDDIHELFLITDLLITDYSSVFFDFAHSKNPMLFFVPDFEKYNTKIRGLYFDMEKNLPGPIIKNNDQLILAIENIEKIKEEYKDSYELFYKKYCSIGHGDASKKVVDALING